MSKEFQDYEANKRRTLEARRLIAIIDTEKCSRKDFQFVSSIVQRLKFEHEIKEVMIYWLRDIKDRQL